MRHESAVDQEWSRGVCVHARRSIFLTSWLCSCDATLEFVQIPVSSLEVKPSHACAARLIAFVSCTALHTPMPRHFSNAMIVVIFVL